MGNHFRQSIEGSVSPSGPARGADNGALVPVLIYLLTCGSYQIHDSVSTPPAMGSAVGAWLTPEHRFKFPYELGILIEQRVIG